MTVGMEKLERVAFDDNREALVGTFSLNGDTDILAMFESIWARFESEPQENIVEMFVGIDVGRDAFLSCFESDDDFKQQPKQKKTAFLLAVSSALQKSVRAKEFLIANGISAFTLWVVAMIQNDYETASHIEKSFADLRNKHDL